MRSSIYRRLVARLSLSPPSPRVTKFEPINRQYLVAQDTHWHTASNITAMLVIAPNSIHAGRMPAFHPVKLSIVLFAVFFFETTAALVAAPAAPVASLAESTSAESTPVGPPALWIAVHLPKGTRPAWVGDDLAERFADRISGALHDQGLKGVIGTLSPEEVASPHASVLEVDLIEWTARGGNGKCTFRASLRTPQGKHELGIFSGDLMIVTADGEHRVSSSGLQDAARLAFANLYARMEATELLASR
jgi:hypothetical protein